MRTILRPLLLLALGLALLFLPGLAVAESPAEQLAVLARQLDTVAGRLEAGDLAGARVAYKAFDDGWFDIEDGIREQSKASYRGIEDAMSDVKYALQAEPFYITKAHAAVSRLKGECNEFIGGRTSLTQLDSAAQEGAVTLSSLVAHLDRAQAKLAVNDVKSAAAEVDTFRRDWIEVEGLVKAKSAQAYADTENNMAKAFALLTQTFPDVTEARATLSRMKADLAPFTTGDIRYGILDSAIILLREGLEALLVVGALLAFLKKTGNVDKGRWIWAGSGVGIIVSVVVAFIVNLIFSRAAAGANRELLEGLTGLVAAAMLIYVSYWLHSKANLSAWQRYISDKSTAALARNSLFSLALIAFLAVFREGAETVLFYVGIAPSIAVGDLVAGLGLGTAALVVIGVLMLVFGIRVPIRPFFLGTSLLIYYLAFKFVGTGIHALQVAGVLSATSADYLPENGFLGVFPTWETTIVQGVLLLGAIAVVLVLRLRAPARFEQAKNASTSW